MEGVGGKRKEDIRYVKEEEEEEKKIQISVKNNKKSKNNIGI